MTILMVLVVVGLYVCLVAVGGMKPNVPAISEFELRRRQKDPALLNDRLRQRHAAKVEVLRELLGQVLGLVLVGVLVAWMGWIMGLVVALAGVVSTSIVARLNVVRTRAQQLYDSVEDRLLGWIERHPKIFVVGCLPAEGQSIEVASREEFLDLVRRSSEVLTVAERAHIRSGMALATWQLSEVMVPTSEFVTIRKDDVVGPLLLDELHKSGHRMFPVLGDKGEVCGVIDVRHLLELQDKRTHLASKLMTPVHFANQSWGIERTMAAFIETHQALLMVVDDRGATVGLVTLQDVIEAMMGRRVRRFRASYDDRSAVASDE